MVSKDYIIKYSSQNIAKGKVGAGGGVTGEGREKTFTTASFQFAEMDSEDIQSGSVHSARKKKY